METLWTVLQRANQLIEVVLGIAVGILLVAGFAFLVAQKITALWSGLHAHSPKGHGGSRGGTAGQISLIILAASLGLPSLAAAEGWWWGSPINPGFDRSTVVQVNGTARRVSIAEKFRPGTLTLDCAHDSYTVMLAPGWYLTQIHVELRDGDRLTVEGSKMMDRQGMLYLVAARVTNERSGAVLELRDELGRPRWMGGPFPRHKVR